MKKILVDCFFLFWLAVSCDNFGVLSKMEAIDGEPGLVSPGGLQGEGLIDPSLSEESSVKVRELSQFFRQNYAEMSQNLIPMALAASPPEEVQALEQLFTQPEVPISLLAKESEAALTIFHTVMLGGDIRDVIEDFYGIMDYDQAQELDEELRRVLTVTTAKSRFRRSADRPSLRLSNAYLGGLQNRPFPECEGGIFSDKGDQKRPQAPALIKGENLSAYAIASAACLKGIKMAKSPVLAVKLAGHAMIWSSVENMKNAMDSDGTWRIVRRWTEKIRKSPAVNGGLSKEEVEQFATLSIETKLFSMGAYRGFPSAWIAMARYFNNRGIKLEPYGFRDTVL